MVVASTVVIELKKRGMLPPALRKGGCGEVGQGVLKVGEHFVKAFLDNVTAVSPVQDLFGKKNSRRTPPEERATTPRKGP